MGQETWAIGVDLGGTKVEVAAVDVRGRIHRRLKQPTDVAGGPEAIIAEIAGMVRQLREAGPPSPPAGLGVGVAGQVTAAGGVVRFAPNLNWREVPLTGPAQPGPGPAGGGHQRCQGRHLGGMAARRRPGGRGPHLPVYRHRHRRRGGERRPDASKAAPTPPGNWGTSPLISTAPGAPAATGAAWRPWPGAGPSPAGPGRPSGTPLPPGRRSFKPRGSKNRWLSKTSTPGWWPPPPGRRPPGPAPGG